MSYPIVGRYQANPIRLSVAVELGHEIDGAWWPHADRITNELPNLVAALTPLLGDINSINVNWSPLQRPPDLNWRGWEHKRQHVMTLSGAQSSVNLLIICYTTNTALAVMLMRCAANRPIDAADRDKPAFLTAGSILRAAQQQRAVPAPQTECSQPSQA
ncbi:DUF5994 family protein [Mycobacterium sp.]|uniref:DUF5994 family protein n=1 Tax=Mycobacterium sp. TaxID=1785 RepID=UPI003F9EA957